MKFNKNQEKLQKNSLKLRIFVYFFRKFTLRNKKLFVTKGFMTLTRRENIRKK